MQVNIPAPWFAYGYSLQTSGRSRSTSRMANVHVAEMPDAPSSKLDCVSEIGHWWLCEASTTFDAESLEPNVLVGCTNGLAKLFCSKLMVRDPLQNPLLDIGPNKANMPICPGHPRTTSWLVDVFLEGKNMFHLIQFCF